MGVARLMGLAERMMWGLADIAHGIEALIESRANSSMPYTQYMEGIIGMLHACGLDWDLIHHGMHAPGSRAADR